MLIALVCPECGADGKDDDRFCWKCGAALRKRCSACNGEILVRARHCTRCGANLDGNGEPAVSGTKKEGTTHIEPEHVPPPQRRRDGGEENYSTHPAREPRWAWIGVAVAAIALSAFFGYLAVQHVYWASGPSERPAASHIVQAGESEVVERFTLESKAQRTEKSVSMVIGGLTKRDRPFPEGRVIETLIRELKAPRTVDPSRRGVPETAAELLEKIFNPKRIEQLVAALIEEYPSYESTASVSDSPIRFRRAGEKLIAALQENDLDFRHEVSGTTGRMRDPRGLQTLIACLRRPDNPWLRTIAAGALMIRYPGTVETFVAILKNEDRQVRVDAIRALGEFGDPQAVEPLIAILQDKNSHERAEAAGALGRIGDMRALEPLIAAYEDGSVDIRRRVVNSLDRFRDPRAIETLIAAIADKDSMVRIEAGSTLGRLEGYQLVRPLMNAMSNGTPQDVKAAMEDLVRNYEDRFK